MKRTLHISDIHGEYRKLKQLLKLVKYNPLEDQLILHGDYVDRGSDNIRTLLYIKKLHQLGAIVLKGNHDEMMQLAIFEMLNGIKDFFTDIHLQCGGEKTYQELLKLNTKSLQSIYDFVSSLPYIYTFDKYICVHAGVEARVPLELNSNDDFIWSRNKFIPCKSYDDKIVIFGHTPVKNFSNELKIWVDPVYHDKIGIDCGSIFGGKLACLELPLMKTYYV